MDLQPQVGMFTTTDNVKWCAYPTPSPMRLDVGYCPITPTPRYIIVTPQATPTTWVPTRITYSKAQAVPNRPMAVNPAVADTLLLSLSILGAAVVVGLYAHTQGFFKGTQTRRKVNGHAQTVDVENVIPDEEVQQMIKKPQRRPQQPNSLYAAYATEEKAINKLLSDHQTGFRTSNADKILITPKTLVFPLQMARGVTFSKLNAAVQPLEIALYNLRAKQGYTDEVKAMVMAQPLSLVVPRVDPITLDWSQRRGQIEARHMLVGLSYATGRPQALTLNLDSPTQFSVLLAGSSGSGKSTLLDGMVLSACEASDPDDFKLMIVDIGRKHFGSFFNLPHCAGFAHTVDGALAMLQYVESQMSGPENSYSHRTAVVIDEIQKLTKCGIDSVEREFKRLLMMIASNGRAYGYSIIISTQKPNAGTIPTDVRDNCVTRIAGRCKSHSQSEMALGDKRTDAVSLSGVGSFVVDDGSNTQIVYSYMLDTDEQIKAIVQQHGDYEGAWFDFEGDTIDEDQTPDTAPNSTSTDIPDGVFDVFEKYADGERNLKRGWKTKAVEAYAQHVGKAAKGRNFKTFSEIVKGMADDYIN